MFDKIAGRTELTILLPPDKKLASIQGNDLSGVLTADDFQFRCDHNWKTPKEEKPLRRTREQGISAQIDRLRSRSIE